MQIGRSVLDAAQRECFDRSIANSDEAVDFFRCEETLGVQIVHRVVGIVRRGMAFGAASTFKEHFLPCQFGSCRLLGIELAKNMDYIYAMLKAGSEKAEAVAAATLDDVKNAMGINYF